MEIKNFDQHRALRIIRPSVKRIEGGVDGGEQKAGEEEPTLKNIRRAVPRFVRDFFIDTTPQRDTDGNLRHYFTDDISLLLLACANRITIEHSPLSTEDSLPRTFRLNESDRAHLLPFVHRQNQISVVILEHTARTTGGAPSTPQRARYTYAGPAAYELFEKPGAVIVADVSGKVREHHTVSLEINGQDIVCADPSILLGLRMKYLLNRNLTGKRWAALISEVHALLQVLSPWYSREQLLTIVRAIAFSAPPSKSEMPSLPISQEVPSPDTQRFLNDLIETSPDRSYFERIPFWKRRTFELARLMQHFPSSVSREKMITFICEHEEFADPLALKGMPTTETGIKKKEGEMIHEILGDSDAQERIAKCLPLSQSAVSLRRFLQKALAAHPPLFFTFARALYVTGNEEEDAMVVEEALPSYLLHVLWFFDDERLDEELSLLDALLKKTYTISGSDFHIMQLSPLTKALTSSERIKFLELSTRAFETLDSIGSAQERVRFLMEKHGELEERSLSITAREIDKVTSARERVALSTEIFFDKLLPLFERQPEERWDAIRNLCGEFGISFGENPLVPSS